MTCTGAGRGRRFDQGNHLCKLDTCTACTVLGGAQSAPRRPAKGNGQTLAWIIASEPQRCWPRWPAAHGQVLGHGKQTAMGTGHTVRGGVFVPMDHHDHRSIAVTGGAAQNQRGRRKAGVQAQSILTGIHSQTAASAPFPYGQHRFRNSVRSQG